MTLPRVDLELASGFLPLGPLKALLDGLVPHRASLVRRWRAAYREAFGAAGFFRDGDLERHLEEELALMLECVATGSLAELWERMSDVGRQHAEAGVPYGELVIVMGLLEECVVAELAAHGESAERQLNAMLLFDKLSHYRITKLAEAYFYRYVELIQEKTRELSETRERNERNMMRAEKLAGLGQLAGGVAHELNNPLATIAITVEDLQDALRLEAKEVGAGWPELAPALERIRSSVKRSTDIIGAMLDLVRHRPPTNEEFRINDLVAKVAEITAFPARGKGRAVELELAPELTVGRSDPRQIEQVLMALISNAVDATESGGVVRIRTRSAGAHFAIEVEDSGPGIPGEQLGRVFEPFFTTKPPGKGTGLGLSMSYSIVKRLKGKLTLESEPERGTLVRVLLPLVNEDVG